MSLDQRLKYEPRINGLHSGSARPVMIAIVAGMAGITGVIIAIQHVLML